MRMGGISSYPKSDGSQLDVVAEHEFLRVRRKVVLVLEIGDLQSTDMVSQERDGDDQGYEALTEVFDHAAQLLA